MRAAIGAVMVGMAVGEVITVTVVGTVDSSVAAGSILTNTATVNSPTFDPNPGNNPIVTTDSNGVVRTWNDLSGNRHYATIASGAPRSLFSRSSRILTIRHPAPPAKARGGWLLRLWRRLLEWLRPPGKS